MCLVKFTLQSRDNHNQEITIVYDVVSQLFDLEKSQQFDLADAITLILVKRALVIQHHTVHLNYLNTHELILNQHVLLPNQSLALTDGDELVINEQVFQIELINKTILPEENKVEIPETLNSVLEDLLPQQKNYRQQESILKKLEYEYYDELNHLPSEYEAKRTLKNKTRLTQKNEQTLKDDLAQSIPEIVNFEYDINHIDELIGQHFNQAIFAKELTIDDILHVFNEKINLNHEKGVLPKHTINDSHAFDIHSPFTTTLSKEKLINGEKNGK